MLVVSYSLQIGFCFIGKIFPDVTEDYWENMVMPFLLTILPFHFIPLILFLLNILTISAF